MGEQQPGYEDQLDFYDWRMGRRVIRNTGTENYKDWTMLYFSWEFDGTTWTRCQSLNAKKRDCYCNTEQWTLLEESTCPGVTPEQRAERPGIDENAESPIDALPQEFLEAIETNTEMLLAPIEFSAHKESRSELQERFYKRKAELEKIKGPRTSEPNRVQLFNSVPEKEVGSYDEKLGLVAPPLMFQKRLQVSSCNPAVATPFLTAQFELINVSHCSKEGMCPNVTGTEDVMTCVGSEESSDEFYGLSTKTLNNEVGFADFLFTYSDNPIVVRNSRTLPTRNFFDSKTQEGKVIAVFVTPGGFSLALPCDAVDKNENARMVFAGVAALMHGFGQRP